jgi:hypothetical protein
MVRGLLKRALWVALALPLGACMQGWPDPIGWVETYPRTCIPGFHAVAAPEWPGYHCDRNIN